jgi:hypothetical protein
MEADNLQVYFVNVLWVAFSIPSGSLSPVYINCQLVERKLQWYEASSLICYSLFGTRSELSRLNHSNIDTVLP